MTHRIIQQRARRLYSYRRAKDWTISILLGLAFTGVVYALCELVTAVAYIIFLQ